MNLSTLRPAVKQKKKKIVGRGPGSGHGKTSCKGHKGENARSGGRTAPGFEGGQMPLIRKLPKRGFKNAQFDVQYAIVNVGSLEERFSEGEQVSITSCMEKGLIDNNSERLKILGNGEIKKSLTVTAHKFSKSANDKILAANGKIEEIKGK